MNKTSLSGNTSVFCIQKSEAKMLDHHIEGYLQHGISIKSGDVVFDVGSNIGVFCLRVAQRASNVKVFAFEPIPEIFNVLKANAQLYKEYTIIPLNFGVSDKKGAATFTYFPNTPALSTLHPEQWDDNPNAFKDAVKGTMRNPPNNMKWMRLIPTMFAGLIAKHLVKGKKQVNCQLRTISSFIEEYQLEKIDLLKIDCEGAEWSVLQGVEELHWPKIRSLVIEVHDADGRLDQVKNFLTTKGFDKLVVERESGLESTLLFNVFALRS
jgi:FkbM family methyltransferase